MIVAIHQPNFLPWCGFFAKLAAADVFILLDDARISNRKDYVSRTGIRAGEESRWLSLPIRAVDQPPIHEVELADPQALDKQLRTLNHTYAKAPFFDDVAARLSAACVEPPDRLADLNIRLIEMAAAMLGISTRLIRSRDLGVDGQSDDRLINLVRAAGGSVYLSGKGGQNYQDPAKFAQAGIELDVRVYRPVPYEAPRFPFVPGLSIIDALAIVGSNARDLLRYH